MGGGVEWTVADGVGRITLDRPGRANTLSLDTSGALAAAIEQVVGHDPRVIVLGARGQIFCGGGDIDEFAAAGDRLDTLVAATLGPLARAFETLVNHGGALVTAVNGAVGGAGVGLALCGDFVLASTAFKLRTGYAGLGLSPDLGSSYFLARRIGPARAAQLFMTGETLSAQRCLELGAIDQLHDEAQLAAAVEDLVQRLRSAAPASLAAIKRLCGGFGARDLGTQLTLEGELLQACARTADASEGIRAFLQKRPPRFEGR
jgi:2-(1,2-epoxy-1,2-dihydrophenyl)acetyl-CoA isomerase